MTPPAFHMPNPLDRVFLAIDEAWRRCGLPGVDIWIHIECDGRVDLAGMRVALRGLARLYPAISSRLDPGGWLRAPRWRMTNPIEDPPVEVISAADADDAQRWVESAFCTRIDWMRSAPLRLYVLRQPTGDDCVLTRWSHAFADARGGVTLIEELARLYDEKPAIDGLRSLGDELRCDSGVLDRRPAGPASRPSRTRPRAEIRWKQNPPAIGRERVALEIRRLDPAQTAVVRQAALRICGVARLGDYLRASAICAMHDVARCPDSPDAVYSTVQLIDNRAKRDRGPVCHNLFSAIPVYVPCSTAHDRRKAADVFQQAAADAIASGQMQRAWRRLERFSRIPTGVLAGILAGSLRSGRRWLPLGLANAPTLPLGFMGPLSSPRATFCGASLRNILGVRPPSVQAGFAINVNYAQERINIAASFFEPRIARAEMVEFLDRYVTCLLDDSSVRA